MKLYQDVLPWEVFTLVALLLAMVLVFSLVRWVFRPRPKYFPTKKIIFFLLCLGLMFYTYRFVPNFSDKLQLGLRQNTASTDQANPLFPELLSPRYETSQTDVFDAAVSAAQKQRGWKVTKRGDSKQSIEIEINVLLGAFKDTMRVSFVPEGNQTRVDIQSNSQKGNADLGANRRHIRQFIRALDDQLGVPGQH